MMLAIVPLCPSVCPLVCARMNPGRPSWIPPPPRGQEMEMRYQWRRPIGGRRRSVISTNPSPEGQSVPPGQVLEQNGGQDKTMNVSELGNVSWLSGGGEANNNGGLFAAGGKRQNAKKCKMNECQELVDRSVIVMGKNWKTKFLAFKYGWLLMVVYPILESQG